MHVLAVRFLGDADLQRAETRLGADLRGQNLIDRRAGGAAAGVSGAGHDAAQRAEVAVALPVEPRRDVVDAAEHVHVVAHAAERRQTRGQLEVLAGLARNPIALRNAVAVPPDEEPLVDARDLADSPQRTPCRWMLNIAASGGSPTCTAAPVMLIPLRNFRLLSSFLLRWSA